MKGTARNGAIIAIGCGCLSILLLIVAAGIAAFFYIRTVWRQADTSTNNLTYNQSSQANANTTNEQFDVNGTSLGFAIDPNFIGPDTYAYQIGAYANVTAATPRYPGMRITLDYPRVEPLADSSDSGSLWVGALLDNDYFIQVGMISSDQVDADGTMQWNYFWEMWDDNNVYQYGLQVPMSEHGWNENTTNTFAMTCQDDSTGEWQFTVNDEIVGKTYTKDCLLDMNATHVFWEMTTHKTDKTQLPEFGPFTLSGFDFWDGYHWKQVPQASLSYSYGAVTEGTKIDQAAVCPPYGAAILSDRLGFQAGSGLDCLEQDTVLWDKH